MNHKNKKIIENYPILRDKNSMLDAAALQDHYARSYNLKVFTKVPTKPLPKKLAPIAENNQELIVASKNVKQRLGALKTELKKNSKVVLDKLNYQDIMGKNIDIIEDHFENQKEQKITQFMKKMTLAQKRGLVKKPDMPLSLEQWKDVLIKAKSRVKEQFSCPICMEDFKLKPQVVLSGTHYFHKDGIESFEKHMKIRKGPIGRFE